MKNNKANNKKDVKGVSFHKCGLCGKSNKNLTKTECCGQWICDDASEYRLFSHTRNSCSRNHRRFTLCSYHYSEGHPGDWQTCKKCLKDWNHELEMYVWYGTNEYNFEKLENIPQYNPTFCDTCGKKIILGDGGYSRFKGKYNCFVCSQAQRNLEDTLSPKQKIKPLSKDEKQEIKDKRREIEMVIKTILKNIKSKYTLEDIKNLVYNEKEIGEVQDLITIFDDGNPSTLSTALEIVMDAWNYFPHKSLGDKCPQEKMMEYN